MTKLYTDYPFVELGDTLGKVGPVRRVEITSYDANKYVDIIVFNKKGSITQNIKAGYIFKDKDLKNRIQLKDIVEILGSDKYGDTICKHQYY